jgi:hypothetical protein
LNTGAVFWKSSSLEEGNDLFLPEDALVLLLQVHKRVASLAVIDIWQTSLDS